MLLSMAPAVWRSKKQSTIEASVFGTEFVVMEQGMEALWGLRCKLRMMGASASGPPCVYGGNVPATHNTQQPELTLKKKLSSACYHAMMHEPAVMGSTRAEISKGRPH